MSAEHTDTQTETRAQWKRWRAQSNTVDEGLIGEGSQKEKQKPRARITVIIHRSNLHAHCYVFINPASIQAASDPFFINPSATCARVTLIIIYIQGPFLR